MKDSAGKAMLLMTQIKNVDAGIELLSRLADQPIKSLSEIFSR
jgi:hypothetical protein